jgi:hypothetical protein
MYSMMWPMWKEPLAYGSAVVTNKRFRTRPMAGGRSWPGLEGFIMTSVTSDRRG